RLGLVLERDHRDDRPEDLLLRDGHRVVDPGEHRRRVEGAWTFAGAASGHDLRALLRSALDEAVDALSVSLRDQRAHLRLRIERVTDLQLPHLAGELRDELVVERFFDQDARARLAALAG